MKRLGLIVNPIAGIGGRAGLKGSDGADVVARARALGGVAEAPQRAASALEQLGASAGQIEIVTFGGPDGRGRHPRTGVDADPGRAAPIGSHDRRRHARGRRRTRRDRGRPPALRGRRRNGSRHLRRDRCPPARPGHPGRRQDPLGGLCDHASSGRTARRAVPRRSCDRAARRGGHGHRRGRVPRRACQRGPVRHRQGAGGRLKNAVHEGGQGRIRDGRPAAHRVPPGRRDATRRPVDHRARHDHVRAEGASRNWRHAAGRGRGARSGAGGRRRDRGPAAGAAQRPRRRAEPGSS